MNESDEPVRMWGGRFAQDPSHQDDNSAAAGAAAAFNASIDVDRRLFREDIEGSIAHCRMLGRMGHLESDEVQKLVAGLEAVCQEIEQGDFEFQLELEDIHTHVEHRLIEKVGDVGKKLHMGRSRNDQVVLDLRLYLKKAIRRIQRGAAGLGLALLDVASEHLETVMPAFTHLQKAQPVTFAHHLTAYTAALQRDIDRFEGTYRRTDILPLGAGAVASTPLDHDAQWLAGCLGFSQVATNSMDAVADRDFGVEFLSSAAMLMVHLSRLSEDMILWSTQAFSYVELADADSTGSSIMPQKKNPDLAELTRGKTGAVIGDLVSLLNVLKGLPMAYNKDLQEDKRPVFHAVDTLEAVLAVYPPMIRRMTVNTERMAADAGGFLAATDYADYLTERGVPFREAHTIVGRLVRYCIEQNIELEDVPVETLKTFSPVFESDVVRLTDISESLGRRTGTGGPAPESVARSIETMRQSFNQWSDI